MANPKNINSLQLLRNAELFANKTEALSKLTSGATNDGTIKLARYTNASGGVSTIFGIYYKADSGSSYTIYDSPKEVIEALEQKVSGNTKAIETLNGANTVDGSVAKSIKDAIEALDVTWEGGTGKVITAITETDGKIAATYTDLSAGNVAATPVTGDSGTVAVNGDTVAAQIDSLAKSIKATSADAKSYKISAVTLSDENVKEAYALFDEDDIQAGETIKIYKDSSLKSVALDGQTLNFTYILANGKESTVGVDVSKFLAESEFKDGLEVSTSGTVSVKIDAQSEGFLTVGEGGLKLSGITQAINDKVESLDATVSAETTDKHVSIEIEEVDGKLSGVTLTTKDIASASALTTETSARTNEDAKIVSGVGFTTITGETGDTYVIAANPSADTGKTLTGNSDTVAKALYTLDDAIAAAKKANGLTAADKTVVVNSSEAGTTVKVNVVSAATVSNFVGYDVENGNFVKSTMFAGIDAGTY